MAVASLALLIPVAAAVHGMSTPVASGQPRTDSTTPTPTGRTRPVGTDGPVARSDRDLAVTDVELPDQANEDQQAWMAVLSTLVNRVRAEQGALSMFIAQARTGTRNFNALPAETPAAQDDGSVVPVVGPATSTEPTEPVLAPATSITQGASIPVASTSGPTAGTTSASAWWSSSASPRSA